MPANEKLNRQKGNVSGQSGQVCLNINTEYSSKIKQTDFNDYVKFHAQFS